MEIKEPILPEYFDQMDFRDIDLERFEADPTMFERVKLAAMHGTGGAMVHDGKILALFGFCEMWQGVYEVWAFASKHVVDYAMIYLRTVKEYVQLFEEVHQPKRIQTTSFDDPVHTRWMQFLGLENETPNGMRNYTVTGKTQNLWAKVYEDN